MTSHSAESCGHVSHVLTCVSWWESKIPLHFPEETQPGAVVNVLGRAKFKFYSVVKLALG